MLKKVGIVVATAAVSMVALSPLAFAGDHHKDRDRGHDRNYYKSVEDNDTTIEVDNRRVRQQGNQCDFDQDQNAFAAGLLGALPLIGAQAQTQALNCVNTGDVTVLDLAND